jgi:hypothetical protein
MVFLLQSQGVHPKIGSKDAPQHTSTLSCILRLRKEQGWVALWRGNVSNVLKKVLTAVVSGCTVRTALLIVELAVPAHKGTVREGLVQQLVAHGAAAIMWTALLYPFEYAHTRLAFGALCGS